MNIRTSNSFKYLLILHGECLLDSCILDYSTFEVGLNSITAIFLYCLMVNRSDPDQMPQNVASDHGLTG